MDSAPREGQPAPLGRPLTAQPPNVSLSVPAEAFLGTNVNFTVTFDNPDPADPGYGPLIDLIIPTNGPDGSPNPDGLTFVNATYLGVNVERTVITVPPSGVVTHPYMRTASGAFVTVTGLTPGDTFVALRLPFGSFTPDQPPATVSVQTSMSNWADVGTPLTIRARGGYQFGYTPLDDWCCGDDPSLTLTSWVSGSVTPTLFTLSKSYSGPEDETATGPNFPRQYTVSAQIAPGQTMAAFNLTDVLPNNMQFVSLVSTSPGGATCTLPSTSTPGGTLSCDFGAVSSTVTMTFAYYIPLRDSGGASVIDPSTGDDALSCNNASGGGNWTPLDPRDTGGTFTQNPAGCEHTLNDRSIAIQKSVGVVGGGDPAPGKYLEYTLDFQVSDFFAFNNIVITDVISDGQHFDPTFVPTLQINGNTYLLSALAMQESNVTTACNYTGAVASPPAPPGECDSLDPAANDGRTTITFNVSNEIIARGQDGRLIGGCVPTTGTGGGDPDCGGYDDGPTTGRIIFRTLIQQDFTDNYPSGDPSVDQGDMLNDAVSISGDVLDTDDASTPTGFTEADGSAAGVTIGRGTLTKSIYAVNGSTSFGTPVEVKPGDTVTYRLTYTLPTGDVENLYLHDYLPMPVFHVGDPDEDGAPGPAWTFSTLGGIPAAGVATFGPSDTFYAYSGIVPTPTTSVANNRLEFTYGDFDGPNEQLYTVDILFTVTVSDDPFADRLYLTNQANAFEGSTNAGTAEANAIVQIILTEPVLVTSKSAIWTSNPNAYFLPATPTPPVTFLDPTNAPRWSGTINSTNLHSGSAFTIDHDVVGVDAGDIVTFAIVIENQGSSPKGAFDVTILDTLPAGFQVPSGGLNLQIYYGNPTYGSITYTRPDGSPASPGDLFTTGIRLVDPVGQGVCSAYDPNLGNNIILITYDLEASSTISPGTITNTATITHYAGDEGGPNHVPTPSPINDDADATTLTSMTKTLVGTEINNAYNTNTQVVIGEYVEYSLVVTVPEGTVPGAQIVDTLDAGLAFMDLVSVTLSNPTAISSSVMTFDGSGNCTNCTPGTGAGSNPLIGSSGSGANAPGRLITFNLGTLTNTDRDNNVPETITLVYRAVTLNTSTNQHNNQRNNSAVYSWSGGSQPAVSAANVQIIEPVLTINKTIVPSSGDAGDSFTYTITLGGPTITDAFDVTLDDAFPILMENIVLTNVTDSAGLVTAANFSLSGNNSIGWTLSTTTPFDMLRSSTPRTITLTFTGTVSYLANPQQTIDNVATLRWTSLDGDFSAARSAYNTNSTERTGAGGVNDYFVSNPATSARFTVDTVSTDKYVVLTSETSTAENTTPWYVAIGEVVRFRIIVPIPEGTSPNFQVRDNLPDGLTFLDDGTARLTFVSNGTGITSTGVGIVQPIPGGCTVSGNSADANSPARPLLCVLDDSNVGSDNSTVSDPDSYATGTDVFFKLGTLLNSDSDADQEFVVIEFNALVDNTTAGSNDAGDDRSNTFDIFINNSQIGSTSTAATVRIAEPSITDLNKSAVPTSGDAGDQITYTLTFSNAGGANNTTAFDVHLTDTVPAKMTFDAGSMNISSSAGNCATGITDNTVGNNVDVTIGVVPAGCAVTVTYTATLNTTVTPQEVLANTANITYTSLPGPNGTTGNPTGSDTPGASGSDTGERDGSGTPTHNDYHDQDTANVTVPNVAITKQIVATSASHTSGSDVAIGEEVTYAILLTFPEGTTPSDTVFDDLPSGLAVISGSAEIITSAAASGGLLSADFNGSIGSASTLVVPGDGGSVQFDFTNVVTNDDGNDNTNNTILLRFRAQVTNIAANQAGTVITNEATNQVGSNPATTSNQVNVTVVEPELSISKTVSNSTPGVGQTFTYTLTIQHLGNSTANAFDLNISDVLPAGVNVTGAPSISAAPAGCAGTITDSSAGNNISLTVASLPLGCVLTVQYSAQIASPPANPGDVITNTANLTWTSLFGVDPNERTGSGGVNDYTDSDNENVTFTAVDLQIAKDDGGITSSAGDTIIYTLNYTNVGNGNATGVVITETVPANTTFNAGASTSGWSCADGSPAGTTCTFTVGSLNAGASGSVDFAVIVGNPLPAGVTQISNTVSIADDGTHGSDATPSDNTAGDTTPVEAAPDLIITKDDGFTVVSPGQSVTYTLTISNVGTQDATGVTVTDTLPADTTFVSASDGGTEAGGVVTWPAFNLAAGAPAVTRTVTIQVNDPFPGTSILNQAHVEDDGTNGADPTPGNNDAGDTDTVLTLPNSDLTKSLVSTNQSFTANSSVAIGEILTYEIVFTVPAGGTMPDLTLSDILDRGLAFVDCVSVTPSSMDISTNLPGGFNDACNAPINPTIATEPSGSSNPADPGRRVTFTLGTVSNSGAADGTVTIRYTVAVLDSLENQDGVSLNNSATLAWASGTLSASASEVTIVEPDFELIKEADRTVAPPGSIITFTLTLRHTDLSNVDAFDVVLTDVLPTGLTYVPGSLVIVSGPAGGVADDSAAPALRVTWPTFPLLTGSTRTEAVVQFQATLGNLNPGQSVTNSASLEWTSLPGDVSAPQSSYNDLSTERYYDPGSNVNVYGVQAQLAISAPALPATGFAPGRTTLIPPQPTDQKYTVLGNLWLEIPRLGLKAPIVGVPLSSSSGWDLTWLSTQVGWLEGTAFPTWKGNSALTAHVYLANGRPGPFFNLDMLFWGDTIIVHFAKQRYIYAVRQVRRVWPEDLSVLRHEEYPWLTLITCREYDEKTERYRYRIVVRAVQIKVEPEQ